MIAGEITISVADVDLIFLGLNVLVSSVEKANEVLRERGRHLRMRQGDRMSDFEFRNADFENSTQLMINPPSEIRNRNPNATFTVLLDPVSNFPRQVVGIAEQEIELVTVDGLVVVTSKFESDVVPLTRENVLRHETVVRSVFAITTPLPFRFGTLVTQQV